MMAFAELRRRVAQTAAVGRRFFLGKKALARRVRVPLPPDTRVFVAREGEEIGDFAADELIPLARTGKLQRSDHYWHEGMEGWLVLDTLVAPEAWDPLPPGESDAAEPHERPPLDKATLVRAAGFALAVLAAVGIAVYLIFRDPAASDVAAASSLAKPTPAPIDTANADVIRDRAVADLKQKIERLPSRAEPPLNTFYYDVVVNVQKTFVPAVPWTAVIRGGENVVDPQTQQTISRTEFVLSAEYRDNSWIYKRYQASTSNLADATSTSVDEDANSPAPPSLVGVLGLKIVPDQT